MPEASSEENENTKERAGITGTEEEILSAIRRGGSEADRAFNRMVLFYQERLYYTIRRMVDNHEDADDILQETFIKAYRKIGTFRGESALFTWLYRIAINLSINHLRKRKIRKMVSLDQVFGQYQADTSGRPDRILETREIKALIAKAKDRLPARQKAVFILRFYEQLSNKEIADITGTAEGTVKANYFFALNKIKAFLGDTSL